jgi:hypothetical protein
MKKLAKFERTYTLVVMTVAAFLGRSVTNYLGSKLTSPSLTFTLLATLLVVSVVISDKILGALIEISPMLRRWICGSDFIEGWWYDVTLNEDRTSIHHVVIYNIYFEGGTLRLSGYSLDVEGRTRATFRSRTASYNERNLFIEYEGSGDLIPHKIEVGVMSLHFGYPANSYTGFYFDYAGTIGAQVAGRKLDESVLKEYGDLQSADKIRLLAKEKLLTAEYSDLGGVILNAKA